MHRAVLLLLWSRRGSGQGRRNQIRSCPGRSWAQVTPRVWSLSVTLKRFSGVGCGCETQSVSFKVFFFVCLLGFFWRCEHSPAPGPAPQCKSGRSVGCSSHISTTERKIFRIPSLPSTWADAVLGCFGVLERRIWVTATLLCSFPDICDVSGGGSVGFVTSPRRGCLQGHTPCDTAPAGGHEVPQAISTPGCRCSGPERAQRSGGVPGLGCGCRAAAAAALGCSCSAPLCAHPCSLAPASPMPGRGCHPQKSSGKWVREAAS